jgi:hypothetical protein
MSRVVRIKIHYNICGQPTMNYEAFFIVQSRDSAEGTFNVIAL